MKRLLDFLSHSIWWRRLTHIISREQIDEVYIQLARAKAAIHAAKQERGE